MTAPTITTIRDLARTLSRAIQADPRTVQRVSIGELDRTTTQVGSIYSDLDMLHVNSSSITFHADRVDLLTQAIELLISAMLPAEPSPTLQIRAQYLAFSHVLNVVMGEPE